jgi:TrmH family RNA methyltransferase
MSNFGFLRLCLVSPWEPSYKEAKSAVGAADVLANSKVYTTLAAAVGDCSLVVGTTAGRNRELHQPLRDLKTGAGIIREHLKSGSAALLFGSEKVGLANEDLSHCHWLLHIPTREQHVSMNLGQAVGVCLYQLRMNLIDEPSAANVEAPQLAPAEDLERITALLLESLVASEYVKPGMEASVEEKLRMLVRGLNLSDPDSKLFMGMVRQILWKLHSDRK